MDIYLAGSRPTRRAPSESFTGTVWQDPIITPQAPARVAANRVAFEPGARTAWHTHPLGQTLYVIAGVGRVQSKGGPIREIKAGDVVILPAGTGHRRLAASKDLLVVGAYPPSGQYDEFGASQQERDRALAAIARVPPPKADPVYGRDGPLTRLWRTMG